MAERNNEKVINIPNKCEDLAELFGIILGDGCVTAYKHMTKKNMAFSLRITCHSIDDFEFLTNHVKNLIKKLFYIKPFLYKVKNVKVICLTVQSVRLVKFLNNHGLKSGNKVKNNQGIPSWIFKNRNYIKRCVRGMIDTDGSVYMCGNGSLFPRIGLDSNISQLRKDFRKALLILDFNPLKWVRNKHMSLYRKKDVFKYIKEIGFSNPKHRIRFERLNKAPVV